MHANPLPAAGDTVHIASRPLHEGDTRRHFAGEVVTIEHSFAHVRGYAFLYDETEGGYARRSGLRDRIFDLADPCCVVNVLPPNLGLDALERAL